MADLNINFQGATLIIPGAYEADNVTAALPNTGPNTPPLLVVGYGYGGKPLTPYSFASIADFQAFLRGGPCAELVPFIANPSPQLNGAQLVTYINASENTQSSYTMFDAAGHAIEVFTSSNYGLPSNLLQISGQAVLGGLGINMTLFDGYANVTQTQANVGVPFYVAYDGTSGNGADITITDPLATGSATVLNLISSVQGESFTIPLGEAGYATAGDIVNYINGTGVYEALVYGDGTVPAGDLDLIISPLPLPAPVGGVIQPVYITAAIKGVAYWANQYGQGLVSASGLASGAPLRGTVFGNITNTHFTGAVSIPPTNQDYANALNVGLTVPAWAVITDTGSAAVQALASQHVKTASSIPYGKWRRYFTGGELGDSVAQALAKAAAITGIEAVYLHPGILAVDAITGQTVTYPGYIAAAAAAAMATGNYVATPLTNKQLSAVGVEQHLSISDINNLQQGSVAPIAITDSTNIPRIVSDFTTWLADNNPENVFTQQVACRFWLAYTLVNVLRNYIGSIASSITELTILNAAKAALNSLIYTVGSNGVINSWDTSSLVLVYTGSNQTAAITVNVTLVGQNRFITVYVPIQALNISISASG